MMSKCWREAEAPKTWHMGALPTLLISPEKQRQQNFRGALLTFWDQGQGLRQLFPSFHLGSLDGYFSLWVFGS